MILVSLPLKFEYDLFVSQAKLKGHIVESQNIGILRSDVIKTKNFEYRVVLAGHGKVNYAISNQFAIDKLRSVKTLIGAGTAGSLKKSNSIGDTLFVSKIVEHDFKQNFFNTKLPEYEISLESKMEAIFDPELKILIGSIACGDEDVTSLKRKEEIHKLTAADAVAWESSGGYRVAQFNKIDYFEFRLISDDAESNDTQLFKQNCQQFFGRSQKAVEDWIEFISKKS